MSTENDEFGTRSRDDKWVQCKHAILAFPSSLLGPRSAGGFVGPGRCLVYYQYSGLWRNSDVCVPSQ